MKKQVIIGLCMLLYIFSSIYVSAVNIRTGIAHYYNLSDYQDSTNIADLVMLGSDPTSVTGCKLGNCYFFDGSVDGLETTGGTHKLQGSFLPFSISLWVNKTSCSGTDVFFQYY